MLDGGTPRLVEVNVASQPEAFNALVLLCSVDGETERERRYVVVSSAYEAVVPARTLDLVAIRHALAHAALTLADPRVVRSLVDRFGSVNIDLSQYSHRKEFFICLGRMLVEIDKALLDRLRSAA